MKNKLSKKVIILLSLTVICLIAGSILSYTGRDYTVYWLHSESNMLVVDHRTNQVVDGAGTKPDIQHTKTNLVPSVILLVSGLAFGAATLIKWQQSWPRRVVVKYGKSGKSERVLF